MKLAVLSYFSTPIPVRKHIEISACREQCRYASVPRCMRAWCGQLAFEEDNNYRTPPLRQHSATYIFARAQAMYGHKAKVTLNETVKRVRGHKNAFAPSALNGEDSACTTRHTSLPSGTCGCRRLSIWELHMHNTRHIVISSNSCACSVMTAPSCGDGERMM